MSGTIQDVVNEIQKLVDALTGVRAAPNYPPDAIPPVLASIAYPASGTFSAQSDGWFKELHTVNVDLVMPAVDLARDLTTLNPFLRSVPNAIMKAPTFTGNASTFEEISYSYITFEDGGTKFRGYRFVINGIKIEPATT